MHIPDVELKEIRDPGLLDFMDYTRIIVNQGKYSLRVVSSVPVGTANDGDMMLYTDGASVYRLYCYLAGTWRYIDFDG